MGIGKVALLLDLRKMVLSLGGETGIIGENPFEYFGHFREVDVVMKNYLDLSFIEGARKRY